MEQQILLSGSCEDRYEMRITMLEFQSGILSDAQNTDTECFERNSIRLCWRLVLEEQLRYMELNLMN